MAGQGTVSIKAHEECLGFEEVTAVDLAAAPVELPNIPAHTKVAYIQAEGGDVKYRDDGSDPDATTGMLLLDTGILMYTGKMDQLKLFKKAGTPKLNISYYK